MITIPELEAMAMMIYGHTREYIETHWSLKALKYWVRKGYKWQVLGMREAIRMALR